MTDDYKKLCEALRLCQFCECGCGKCYYKELKGDWCTEDNHPEFFDCDDKLKLYAAASPWRKVEDEPRDGQECIVAYLGSTDWIYEHATYHGDLNKALDEDIFIDGTDGFIVDGDVGYARHSFKYWMPIEPPKEDENGSGR